MCLDTYKQSVTTRVTFAYKVVARPAKPYTGVVVRHSPVPVKGRSPQVWAARGRSDHGTVMQYVVGETVHAAFPGIYLYKSEHAARVARNLFIRRPFTASLDVVRVRIPAGSIVRRERYGRKLTASCVTVVSVVG